MRLTKDGLDAMYLLSLKSSLLVTRKKVLSRRDANYSKDLSVNAQSTSIWSSQRNSRFSLTKLARSPSRWRDCPNRPLPKFWISTASTSPRFKRINPMRWLRTVNASIFSRISWPSVKCQTLPIVTQWSTQLKNTKPTPSTTPTSTAYWCSTRTLLWSTSPRIGWKSAASHTPRLAISKSTFKLLCKLTKTPSLKPPCGSRVKCWIFRVWSTRWRAVSS